MFVCLCRGVTSHQVADVARQGATTSKEVEGLRRGIGLWALPFDGARHHRLDDTRADR